MLNLAEATKQRFVAVLQYLVIILCVDMEKCKKCNFDVRLKREQRYYFQIRVFTVLNFVFLFIFFSMKIRFIPKVDEI